MSFAFYIEAPDSPMIEEIVAKIEAPDLHCQEEDFPGEGPWPEEKFFHFYRYGISTQPIEAGWENEHFVVRLQMCSCEEDGYLALHFAERAALALNQPIKSEEGLSFQVENLPDHYGKKWVQEMARSGAFTLREIIREEKRDKALALHGPLRPFFIGSQLLTEIEEAGPLEEFPQRLYHRIRQVQYIDHLEYYHARALMVERDKDDPLLISAWGPDEKYVFPYVDRVALLNTEGEVHFTIPYEAIPQLAGDKCHFLDEKQIMIEAFGEEEWRELVERARPLAIEAPS